MSGELRRALRAFLDSADRGMATEIACNTSLTKPEVSQFRAEARPMTSDKLVEMMDFLLANEYVVIDVRKQGP